jgi:hypothetical protein
MLHDQHRCRSDADCSPGRRTIAVLFCAAFLGFGPRVATAGSTVAEYRNATVRALDECAKFYTAPRKPYAPKQRSDDCIREAQKAAAERLAEALASVRNPAARGALMRYHELFNEAIAGVHPRRGEPAAAYEQRQASSSHTLSHAWTRFELAE